MSPFCGQMRLVFVTTVFVIVWLNSQVHAIQNTNSNALTAQSVTQDDAKQAKSLPNKGKDLKVEETRDRDPLPEYYRCAKLVCRDQTHGLSDDLNKFSRNPTNSPVSGGGGGGSGGDYSRDRDRYNSYRPSSGTDGRLFLTSGHSYTDRYPTSTYSPPSSPNYNGPSSYSSSYGSTSGGSRDRVSINSGGGYGGYSGQSGYSGHSSPHSSTGYLIPGGVYEHSSTSGHGPYGPPQTNDYGGYQHGLSQPSPPSTSYGTSTYGGGDYGSPYGGSGGGGGGSGGGDSFYSTGPYGGGGSSYGSSGLFGGSGLFGSSGSGGHSKDVTKKILLPLAGAALLGVAAALVANPVLLQLGVVSGKRRRRDLTVVQHKMPTSAGQRQAYRGHTKGTQ